MLKTYVEFVITEASLDSSSVDVRVAVYKVFYYILLNEQVCTNSLIPGNDFTSGQPHDPLAAETLASQVGKEYSRQQ